MYVLYDADGKIQNTYCCPEFMWPYQIKGVGLTELIVADHVDIKNKYVVSGALTDRPAQLTTIDKTTMLADGVDAVTISGCPDGAVFTATMGSEVLTGIISGTDTFTTVLSGEYRLSIERWPYLTWEATINAV